MSDLLDDADTLQAEHLARSLARVDATIPAGVAGICDDCGEDMPRLVGGRCGYCRDGRPHPFERSHSTSTRPATGAPARAPAPAPVKDTTMPNPAGSKTVGFTARGAVLVEIDRRVAAGSSVSAAVLEMVEAGLGLRIVPDHTDAGLVNLGDVPLPDLLDELRARVDRATAADDLLARATAAETKLETIAATLAPAGAGA